MNTVAQEKVIGNGSKRCKGECGKIKPYSEFYIRSGYGTPENPALLDGHFNSECIECMRVRGRNPKRLEPWISRVESEQLAIDYLMDHGIWATTGKMTNAPDVDVACWGSVWVEVKYAKAKTRGYKTSFSFTFSPPQQDRGILAHVVMLICEYEGPRRTFHILPANEASLYNYDGRLKAAVAYVPGKRVETKKGQASGPQLLQQTMDAGLDNVALIWEWQRRLYQALCDGQRPEYGKPFGR